jgi:hypothetical protein
MADALTPESYLNNTMDPAGVFMTRITGVVNDDNALCQVLATFLYETALETKVQEPVGYGHGYGQLEEPTVQLLLNETVCGPLLVAICKALDVEATASVIWTELLTNDVLGFCCTRLLYWADPNPMPTIGDTQTAWQTYLRVQRPGAPSESRWNIVYPQATACFPTEKVGV